MRRFGTARGLVAATVATLVALGGVILPAAPAGAVAAASLTDLKAQALYFEQTANAGRQRLAVDSMATVSARDARLWADFLASWTTINASLAMNATTPKGLPSKNHVFVVLGSALTKSGKMTTKLVRRMKVALAALKKYPNSRVLVSGGAPRNGHTEADVMRAWLVSHKIKKSRIIVEKKSTSTVGNANESMQILAGSSVTSYSLISGSSHLRRASVLFLAATLRIQEESGKDWAITQSPNVAHIDMARAGKGPLSASSVAYTASNVASVLKIMPSYKAVLASPPGTAVLTALTLTAPARTTYEVGESLLKSGLVVKAIYNKGVYSRVVTSDAKVSGFDTSAVGQRKVSAVFTDGGVTLTSSLAYTVVKADSSIRTSLSTRTVRQSKTRVVVKASVGAANGLEPSGKVRFYLDGKRLRTITLADDQTEVSFTYPRIGTIGTHRITVKFAGNAQLEAARKSTTITVKT